MKTLEPIDKRFSIKRPDKTHSSEFEVQAYLYAALLKNGCDVRGEVAWSDPVTRIHCRFDLVIFKDGDPLHIVEVKHSPVKHRTALEDTRQGRRYRMFGVPVTFVYGIADANDFVAGWTKCA